MFKTTAWKPCLYGALAVLAMVCLGTARADFHDVKADWSDASNPNGVWSYCEGANPLPHVTSWQSGLGGWSSAQPGWAESENGSDRLPFWFRSNGTETFVHDYLEGDIVVHTQDDTNGAGNGQANLRWTSPISGIADVAGAVWMGRDIGRSNDWKIYLNNTLLTSGSLASGDVYSRASPFDLATGSAGAAVLQDIAVNVGDVIRLQLERTGQSGDFVGINFSVETTVPEPATLLLLGGAAVAANRRRRVS